MSAKSDIELNINAKDECWLKLFSSMLTILGINMKNQFPQAELSFEISWKDLTMIYRIKFLEENRALLEKYIQDYALALLDKKPLSDLFSGSYEMMQFKQHLDLSALELKIYRDLEQEDNNNTQEIFTLHAHLAQGLLNC